MHRFAVKKAIFHASQLALLTVSVNVSADYALIKGQYGELDLTLNFKTAAFAENDTWFGQVRENIGDPANFWWEGSAEDGVKGSLNFLGGNELYGAYSYLQAQTVGHDASGLSNGQHNPGTGDTEKLYAGWRSGTLFLSWEKMPSTFQEDDKTIRSAVAS